MKPEVTNVKWVRFHNGFTGRLEHQLLIYEGKQWSYIVAVIVKFDSSFNILRIGSVHFVEPDFKTLREAKYYVESLFTQAFGMKE